MGKYAKAETEVNVVESVKLGEFNTFVTLKAEMHTDVSDADLNARMLMIEASEYIEGIYRPASDVGVYDFEAIKELHRTIGRFINQVEKIEKIIKINYENRKKLDGSVLGSGKTPEQTEHDNNVRAAITAVLNGAKREKVK